VLTVSASSLAAETPADTVFLNGGIYTVDAQRSWAQAAAVRGGRIVGTNEQISAYRGDKTVVVDLTNRLALPGFHDSHVHVAAAGLEMMQCPLTELASVQAILDKVASCAHETRPAGSL
jgi:predicted amidohydrolase YtcJ